MARDEGSAVTVLLADDAGLLLLAVQRGLELFLDDGRFVLDDQDLVHAAHHGPQREQG